MRGVIIGYGAIAQGHLAGYGPGGPELAAIVDTSSARRGAARADFPRIPVLASLSGAAEAGADFADICTPPASHHPLMTEALDLGMHVLCEKPFLLDLDAYDDVCEMSRRANRLVMPSHNYKYSPAAMYMRQVLQGGALGRLHTVVATTSRTGHALGTSDYLPDWRRQREIAGGGILTDHGPHSVYIANWLVGEQPCAVTGLIGHSVPSGPWADTEDTAAVTLFYGSGIRWDISLSWSAPTRETTYTLVGDRGSLHVDGDHVTLNAGGSTRQLVLRSDFNDPTHRSWFGHVMRDFLNAVDSVQPPSPEEAVLEARQTTAVLEAAYASAANGGARVVPRELALAAPLLR